ncbi:MAG: hypothetical protein KGZ79_15505 [Dethiobacter sp.]|jgi:hypothetical protein|nr:hypothetical protein [Dethiobacter sp.]
MNMTNVVQALLVLCEEAFAGPSDPRGTWFTSNEQDSGFLGTVKYISAAEASRYVGAGGSTIAGHTNHLRFALNLANRACRGENAHAGADWKESWHMSQFLS